VAITNPSLYNAEGGRKEPGKAKFVSTSSQPQLVTSLLDIGISRINRKADNAKYKDEAHRTQAQNQGRAYIMDQQRILFFPVVSRKKNFA
jgi:hypothetical protein